MPRYKCKVDRIISFEFELHANSKEDVENKIIKLDLDEVNAINITREIESIEELPEIAALFTLPVLPDTASDRMKEAFNVMVEEIQLATQQPILNNFLNQEYSDDPTSLRGDFLNHKSKEKIRKQSDTTKITQKQYDEIIFTYSKYKDGLLLGVNSSDKLANYLNGLLGLNKSRSVYSKIWCGGVDRESLSR